MPRFFLAFLPAVLLACNAVAASFDYDGAASGHVGVLAVDGSGASIRSKAYDGSVCRVDMPRMAPKGKGWGWSDGQGCLVSLWPRVGGGWRVSSNADCRAYCGASAWFEGDYLPR